MAVRAETSAKKLLFMVKADGYGHGAAEVASAVEDAVDMFGVATVEEGEGLRRAGVKADVLAAVVPPSDLLRASRAGLTVAITSCSQMRAVAKLGRRGVRVPVHVKLDTGMHRLGVEEDEINCVLNLAKQYGADVRGVYSHLRMPNAAQKEAFDRMSQPFKQAYPDIIRHLASSSALALDGYSYDMVRVGLKGYANAMTVASEVVSSRFVRAGEYIGYGETVCKTDGFVAIVFGGYADGVQRETPSSVLIRGRECPVIGKVCMDLFAVVTEGFCAKEGETAILLGGELTAKRVAEQRNSVEYTVPVNFGGRAQRIYFDDKTGSKGASQTRD